MMTHTKRKQYKKIDFTYEKRHHVLKYHCIDAILEHCSQCHICTESWLLVVLADRLSPACKTGNMTEFVLPLLATLFFGRKASAISQNKKKSLTGKKCYFNFFDRTQKINS